jgi:hypothetical protein
MILVVFSVVVVSAAIMTKQTGATADYGVHPVVALCTFWFSLAWLAILEGGLNAMVGLQPIPSSVYESTHRKSYLCTKAAHKSDNIERFIVGRQYLDLTIVFTTAFMVSTIDGAQVLGLPPIVNEIFLGSDLGVMLCTIVFGQLISVINCSHNMLDYINNWCMVGSTYLALIVEASGILHAVYFVQIIFTKIANRNKNKNNKSNKKNNKVLKRKQSDIMNHDDANSECDGHSTSSNSDSNSSGTATTTTEVAPAAATAVVVPHMATTDDSATTNSSNNSKPLWKRILFWARVVFSLGISVFAVVVFTTALIGGNTTVRKEIPVPVSIISLLILLVLGGFMEALQIALFAVKHLDRAKIEANPTARRNCELFLSGGSGDAKHQETNTKFQAFLVGRQIAQTVIMFMIARIITVDMKVQGETLFGVSPKVQAVLFDSGLLNALVSTIFASLSWRVTANFFPMLYLGSPISIWIIRLCLIVEGTGICDSAWLLAKIVAAIVGYKSDESYINAAGVTSGGGERQQEEDLESGKGVKNKHYKKQSSIITESIGSSSSCASCSGEEGRTTTTTTSPQEHEEC